jgi:hypothetical protein
VEWGSELTVFISPSSGRCEPSASSLRQRLESKFSVSPVLSVCSLLCQNNTLLNLDKELALGQFITAVSPQEINSNALSSPQKTAQSSSGGGLNCQISTGIDRRCSSAETPLTEDLRTCRSGKTRSIFLVANHAERQFVYGKNLQQDRI